MLSFARIGVGPDDLAAIVDPIGLGGSGAGHIQGRKDAGVIEKAMHISMRIIVDADDLAAIVDPIGPRECRVGHDLTASIDATGTGHIERCEDAGVIEKAMLASARIGVGPDDLAAIINAEGLGVSGAGHVEWCDDAGVIEKAMLAKFATKADLIGPHHLTVIVNPMKGSVVGARHIDWREEARAVEKAMASDQTP